MTCGRWQRRTKGAGDAGKVGLQTFHFRQVNPTCQAGLIEFVPVPVPVVTYDANPCLSLGPLQGRFRRSPEGQGVEEGRVVEESVSLHQGFQHSQFDDLSKNEEGQEKPGIEGRQGVVPYFIIK
jgi:hypothetical protein